MNAAAVIDTLHDVIFSRRSVREYTGKLLEPPAVERLLEAAVRAPTAVHAESWRFAIVQNAGLLQRLSDRAKELSMEQSHRLHFPRDTQGLAAFSRPDFNVFYNAGTLIVICAPSAGPFAAADCWLAAENLMLTAQAMGLGCCTIGSAVAALNTDDTKAELAIPADYSAVAPIIVGFPRGPGRPTERKPPKILAWR